MLANKVAVVTGAAQGLGKEFCRVLLSKGAKVAVLDIDKTEGQKTCDEFKSNFGDGKVNFFECNITSQDQVEDAFKQSSESLGGLDIVVNNAGVGGEKSDSWEATVDVNLKGTMRATLVAISKMRKDKGGKGGVIVNVSSAAGLNPNPCGPVYNATKSAINMFSSSLSKSPDLLANGVRINVLCPGFVQTKLMSTLMAEEQIYEPAIAKAIVSKVGILTVEETAGAILELVSDETKNGAVLLISKNAGKQYVG